MLWNNLRNLLMNLLLTSLANLYLIYTCTNLWSYYYHHLTCNTRFDIDSMFPIDSMLPIDNNFPFGIMFPIDSMLPIDNMLLLGRALSPGPDCLLFLHFVLIGAVLLYNDTEMTTNLVIFFLFRFCCIFYNYFCTIY